MMFDVRRKSVFIPLVFLFVMGTVSADEAGPIDFGRLLDEMHDLAGLARWPDAEYKTIQYSSYDRRSVSPEKDEWYSNTDGFGKEPIPGFVEVLEEPDEEGVGLYLVADVKGPGAMVRGWSAYMLGELKAYLDGSETPFYEGTGYDFMARKSVKLLNPLGDADHGNAFCQADADYMPIPFAESLRVTWKGKIEELHFYHLEVRLYEEGTRVVTFDPECDPTMHADAVKLAAERLTQPGPCETGQQLTTLKAELEPGKVWDWNTIDLTESGAIIGLTLNLMAEDPRAAWRGTMLRIAFDGADRPQVESPAGDFFGSGVDINLFNSLPMAVDEDGAMTCRFVMPYREHAEISLYNTTDKPINAAMTVTTMPWEWDDRSMYFRAKWRTVDHIDMTLGPFDIPYVVACGQGRFVGAACMLANPSPFPHPYGSWWGEGDEKIFVDNEPFPCFFGTGSEDYYNYAWSRPSLFDHPYCGQPLDSGPGNAGYCSNHRWHILDDIPFKTSFAFYMEMWPHSGREGLCYGSIAYLYSKPGLIDDHCRLQKSQLMVPDVPPMQPEAGFGSHGGTFHIFEKMTLDVSGGALGYDATQPAASQGRLVTWTAEPGDRLSVKIPIAEDKEYSLYMVAAHWPESGKLRMLVNNTPLVVSDLGGATLGERDSETWVLTSTFPRRLLNTSFKAIPVTKGEHTVTFECVEGGRFGLDYLWLR